jgi:hypothetical protein
LARYPLKGSTGAKTAATGPAWRQSRKAPPARVLQRLIDSEMAASR